MVVITIETSITTPLPALGLQLLFWIALAPHESVLSMAQSSPSPTRVHNPGVRVLGLGFRA